MLLNYICSFFKLLFFTGSLLIAWQLLFALPLSFCAKYLFRRLCLNTVMQMQLRNKVQTLRFSPSTAGIVLIIRHRALSSRTASLLRVPLISHSLT